MKTPMSRPLSCFVLLDDENIFAYADAAFYATPDLRFSVGYRHLNNLDMAAVGAEWQLPTDFIGGTSLFAEGRIGEDDYASVWAGLRVYLSAENKTLIRRHREDDPGSKLTNNNFDFDSCAIAPAPQIFVAENDQVGVAALSPALPRGCSPNRR